MTTTRTAKFVMSPETPEEIIFPIGDPDETRRHIEIFLTEDLADGEDLDSLTITRTGPYTWQAKYIFDLEWQTLYFVQVAEPAPDLLESLRLALQERGRVREEVDVRVGGHPALRAEVGEPPDLEDELALARLDREAPADRGVLEALR